jgi:peptide subunit release factor 1 (eRF1)
MKNVIRAIDQLSRFDTGGRRVLSLYLATDPSRGPGQNLRAQVRDLLHPLTETRADGAEDRQALETEMQTVADYIDRLAERPRGLALFTSGPLGLFEALPLAIAPEPRADWARRVNLRPLISLLDEHEPTIVLLVDKERARIFRWLLDSIEEVASFEDEVPVKHSQGGESQKNFQRHHEEHVLQHVRRAVDALERHAAEDGIRRIAIGGPAEVLSHVRRMFPQQLKSLLAGELAVPLFASAAQVLEAARAVEGDWESEEEIRLVADLNERVGRGRAVLGTHDVVNAVVQQRVRILVFSERASLPGARCTNCAILFGMPAPGTCPACGGEIERVDDLLDLLASRVLQLGGNIEEVRGQAAMNLNEHDGVGALLYYPAPSKIQRAG